MLRLVDNLIPTKYHAEERPAKRSVLGKSPKSRWTAPSSLICFTRPRRRNRQWRWSCICHHAGAREDSDDYQSPLDLLFEALEEEQPDHIAVKQYKIYARRRAKLA